MDDLVRWLTVQHAEGERIARAVHGPADKQWWTSEDVKTRLCDDQIWMADAEFIAGQSPARVLREIEANRRRLERHTPKPMVGRDSDENDPSTYVLGCPTCQVGVVGEGDWPCEEMRDLLVVYADGPGYLEEWRP